MEKSLPVDNKIHGHSRICHGLWLLCAIVAMQGCSYFAPQKDSAPRRPVDVSEIPDAVPKPVTRSKYGNPQSYVVMGKRYHVVDDNRGFTQKGIASWYGAKFHGRRTSNGEVYDMYAMTAAHKTLLIPTYVKVTNLENDKTTIVKVNDRGPFHEGRIIDLSYAAAKKLGVTGKGTTMVEIRVVEPGDEISDNKAPASDTKKYAPVETLQPVDNPSPAQLFIQVGAFSKLDNAEKLRIKLSSIGNNLIKISKAIIGNQSLYRVRIGPFPDRATVQKIIRTLEQLQQYDHHIVDH